MDLDSILKERMLNERHSQPLMDVTLFLTGRGAEPVAIAVPDPNVAVEIAAQPKRMIRAILNYEGDGTDVGELLRDQNRIGVYVRDMCWATMTHVGPVIVNREEKKAETYYSYCELIA